MLRFAGITLDVAGHCLTGPDGSDVPLTSGEWNLLRCFVQRPGRVLSREHLLQAISGQFATAYDRSIDMLISRLRRKIEPDRKRPSLILTIPGSGYKFASKVAVVVAGVSGEPLPLRPPPPSPPAERRQLTILQCALSGPVWLAAQREPEDLPPLLAAFHADGTQVIVQAAGTVARLLDDGLLAYFGYPHADEHQAEHAVRAALGLLRMAGGARVGVATGLVVVGALPGDTCVQAALGEPTRLATALLARAGPDTVLISAATRRLVMGLFQCEPHDGGDESEATWQVIDESIIDDRFEALHGQDLSALVGREEELAMLLRRWQQARAGEGCAVLIAGEPGIGKSRLVKAMLKCIGTEPHTLLSHFCSPHHQDSPLHPVISHLQRAAGLLRDDTAERRRDKLEALLAPTTETLAATAALVTELVGIPSGSRYPPLNLTPQERQDRTLAALVARVEKLAARGPVLMTVEDAQWMDATTREMLERLIDRLPAARVLLVLTFRPEFVPPWIDRAQATLLTLNRLRRRDSAELIARVAKGRPLPGALADRILERAGGVPLFIEELTKVVLDSGTLTADGVEYAFADLPSAIPESLHASLLARLDRLGPARQAAQIGAALGRQFAHEVIRAVAELPVAALEDALVRLASAELIFRRGAAPDAEYTFKHALVRDAAYDTLLKTQRQDLHARIAQVLERQFPEIGVQQPEVLAQHYQQAGIMERAARSWYQAGRQSATRSSMTEAVAQLRRGLELLTTVPESGKHRRLELDLLSALGGALVASHGLAAPETAQTYARARALAEQLGDFSNLLSLLSGQVSTHIGRGEYVPARQVAEELLQLAERHGAADNHMIGCRAMGLCLHIVGEPVQAVTQFERVLSLYDPLVHQQLAAVAAYDMRAVALVNLSWDLFILGDLQQSLLRGAEALHWSRAVNHLHTRLYALTATALFELLRGDIAAAEEALREICALAEPQDLRLWLAPANIIRGTTLLARGEALQGLSLARAGIAEKKADGSLLNLTCFLALLAQCYDGAGEANAAWDALAEAVTLANATGERWFEAELHRRQGDWIVAHRAEAAAEAQACYQRALEIARKQGARMWELRAATSLARLSRHVERKRQALDLLTSICHDFDADYNMPELKDTKRLLDELEPTQADCP